MGIPKKSSNKGEKNSIESITVTISFFGWKFCDDKISLIFKRFLDISQNETSNNKKRSNGKLITFVLL